MSERVAGKPRTDAEIYADARQALDRSPRVPEGVRVHVADAVVTLTGDVQWPYQRLEAEQAVAAVPGVARVDNRLVVWNEANPYGWEPPEPDR